MTHTRRCGRRAALLAAGFAALLGAGIGYAQDDLGGAKTLYVNASYEEALGLLDKQAAAAGQTGARAAELHHYRALCLIALGRTAEADQAIALSVAADPFSVPDTSELAPRVASVFTAARARLVPDVARAALADGRQLMQKGDAAAANKRFEAVTRLLAEPGLAGRADLADLTLAANAFTELTRAQMAAAAAAATPPPSAADAPPRRRRRPLQPHRRRRVRPPVLRRHSRHGRAHSRRRRPGRQRRNRRQVRPSRCARRSPRPPTPGSSRPCRSRRRSRRGSPRAGRSRSSGSRARCA